MGDINQLLYIRQYANQFHGPYLEVGSKDYGSSQDLRSLFAPRERYLGIDMSMGTGVDVVLDVTADFDLIDATLHGLRFGTIFCLSVLEHCELPFRMAENLTRLLAPGGSICLSVPFSWKFHGYPSDYWRFTQEGVKKLFPKLEFNPAQTVAATSREGEMRSVDQEVGLIPFSSKAHWRRRHPLRSLSAVLLRTLARLGIWSWLCGYRYVLAPTNLFMIGTLRVD